MKETIISSMEKFIQKFFEELYLILFDYALKIAQNPIDELLIFGSIAIAYTVIYISGLFFARKINLPYIRKILEIGISVIFYFLVSLLEGKFPQVESLLLLKTLFLVQTIRVFILSLEAFQAFGFTTKLLINIFSILGGISFFIIKLVSLYKKKNIKFLLLSKTFTFLYKFSIALLLWIFLRTLFKVAIKRFKGSGFESVLNSLWFVLSASYVAFTGAWILNLVKFSVDFIVDVAVFFVIFLVYAAVFGYSVYLIGKFFGDTDGYENLLKSFKKFAYMFSIYILYKSLIYLTNIEVLVKKLERIYILETELVKISLFSFVEGIYVFFVLKYFFETLGNLFYVVYMKKDQEVEAGSFRTITVNLGLLLSLLIAGVSIGITWKAAVPIAGALGIGLGFGLQTIFNNYVSGFILLLSKNIKVGDYIEIEGKAGAAVGAGGDTIFGRVVSINILTTIVRTWDNVEVAIPNSEFLSSKIVNYSMTNPIVRVRIPFGVAYSSDPEKVREVLIRVAKRMPHVLPSPEPDVWFHEMGDSALIFILLVWVDLRRLRRLKALKSSIYYEAWKELKKEGIEIPFPQRDVWFRNKLKVEIEKDIKPEQ